MLWHSHEVIMKFNKTHYLNVSLLLHVCLSCPSSQNKATASLQSLISQRSFNKHLIHLIKATEKMQEWNNMSHLTLAYPSHHTQTSVPKCRQWLWCLLNTPFRMSVWWYFLSRLLRPRFISVNIPDAKQRQNHCFAYSVTKLLPYIILRKGHVMPPQW